jgi:cbb3-type cytochrome oxidase maturation protein
MNILLLLGPFSVLLGLMAVGAFVWTLRASQYDDIQGAAERILIEDDDNPDSSANGDGAVR